MINRLSKKSRRQRSGVAIVEAVIAALLLFLPILYVGMDLTVIVMASSLNEHMARDAARAASSQTRGGDAFKVAQQRVMDLRTSDLVTNPRMTSFDFVPGHFVSVQTVVQCRLPAPFPFFTQTDLRSQATVPLVSTPADL